MQTFFMTNEARKLKLIEAVRLIDDEIALTSIENIVAYALRPKLSAAEIADKLFGIMSAEEAEAMRKVINDSVGRKYPNDK